MELVRVSPYKHTSTISNQIFTSDLVSALEAIVALNLASIPHARVDYLSTTIAVWVSDKIPTAKNHYKLEKKQLQLFSAFLCFRICV